MAKHRRRRRHRRMGSMVEIPGLGMFGKSVNTTDVLMGAALGFGGTLLLKGLGNKLLGGKVPDTLLKGSPLVGGLLVGAGLWAVNRKNKSKANAQLFGALLAGGSVQAWDVLKTSFPDGLGDVVSLKMGSYNPYGVFVDEKTPAIGPGGAAYNGLIVDDESRRMSDTNLAELASMSLGGMGESGLEDLMEMDG